ncbi:MAG: hypothetical protein V7676_12240 [Parasphingorhabdus sp.]|uniref:cyclic GMP-AMP synthase DncV-like nucleotidyltransferase n=1 Tax=Parasphingorhabdus sp. TaxID=2709688 RepID=UPI00300207F9
MYDTSKMIKQFLKDHVSLSQSELDDIKSKRDRNLKRVEDGLAENGKPSIVQSINQGSYAMQTMVQTPEQDDSRYDIDLGVSFDSEESKTPKTTRGWVKDALAAKASNMKNEPEDKGKCIRIVYADGYQCDFPVFRKITNADNTSSYEVALNDDWEPSDPNAINKWFNDRVSTLSPEIEGPYQLRRVVKLIKFYSKTWQGSSNTHYPSGLLLTAITVQCFKACADRDDEALYGTLKSISLINENLPVFANGIQISREKDVVRIKRLKDRAVKAIEHLDGLHNDADMDNDEARKCWKKVYKHSFFDPVVNSSETSKSARFESATKSSTLLGIGIAESTARAEALAKANPSPTKPWGTQS